MAQNNYHGKWNAWIHKFDSRWVVAEKKGEFWCSCNTQLSPGHSEFKAWSLQALVDKGVRTYASSNGAIKALRRMYPEVYASKARAKKEFPF